MNNWEDFFNKQSKLEYFNTLLDDINNEYIKYKCHPLKDDIFKAFKLVKYEDIKVVIIGQDPYHNDNQAMGLSFSVPNSQTKLPPSLQNIFKELYNDLNINNTNGDLTPWCNQGVLLINSILSVRHNTPMSHNYMGYDKLMINLLEYLNYTNKPIIYVLWGNNCRKYKKYISNRHYIIESAHPSPLSAYRGFFNSKPFSKINNILKANNQTIIDWNN